MRHLYLMLWITWRTQVNAVRHSRPVRIVWILVLTVYLLDFGVLALRHFKQTDAAKIDWTVLIEWENAVFYAALVVFAIMFFFSSFSRSRWQRFKVWLSMPVTEAQLADMSIGTGVLAVTIGMMFAVLSILVIDPQYSEFSLIQVLSLVPFFILEFSEPMLLAMILAAAMMGLATRGYGRRYFPVKLAGIGAAVGVMGWLYHRYIGFMLPLAPLPGAFESFRQGKILEGLVIHAAASYWLFYAARLTVRDFIVKKWETLEQISQDAAARPSGRRFLNLWLRLWPEPMRSLIRREFFCFSRESRTQVAIYVIIGLMIALAVLLKMEGCDFLRLLSGTAFVGALLTFGVLVIGFFFLAISSFGGDRRDMELLAAQPVTPQRLILAKSWAVGLVLAGSAVFLSAASIWLYYLVQNKWPPVQGLALTATVIVADFYLAWVAVCVGGILPDPRRNTNRFFAASSAALSVSLLIWILVAASVAACHLATQWVPGRIYHLPVGMIILWALVGYLLHKEAVVALSESYWALPPLKQG